MHAPDLFSTTISLLLSLSFHAQYPAPLLYGYDFRDNLDVDRSVIGKYTTELLNTRAEQIIAGHNRSEVCFQQVLFEQNQPRKEGKNAVQF